MGGKEFDTVNFLEEMGDLEFYRSIPYHQLNWTEKQVRDTNYFKLEKRYPEGYTDNSANNRDLESERKILEKGLNDSVYVALTSYDAFHGIKIPAVYTDLMREIESTYNEMIEGVFTDYNEYRDFEVECASQARHGTNGTTEYESLGLEDILDLWDVEKEQITKLESYKLLTNNFKNTRRILKRELLTLRSEEEIERSEYLFLGQTKAIPNYKFINGICTESFHLYNWDKYASNWRKNWMSSTLEFYCNSPIYYGDVLVAKEFQNVPFYRAVHSWTEESVIEEKISVVIDLRVAGIYGEDFNPRLLNLKEIIITPSFNVPRDEKKHLYPHEN